VSNPSTNPRSRAWVEVDLGALTRNLLRVRAAAPACAVVPMVKADGYGLGALAVGRACLAAAPDAVHALGVAAVAEGEALRAGGWTRPVIVFAPVLPGEEDRAAAGGLTLCLSTPDGLRRWADAARRAGRRLPFHLEVDTGMGRAGLPWARAAEWAPMVAAEAGDQLAWEGCFTHFHSADEPDLAPTDGQWARFEEALRSVPPHARRVVHAANSAGAVRRAGYAASLVRPGIFLFGGAVGADEAPEPVAAVRARIALVRQVEAGATLGYGATYVARRPERWGTLAIGYGDGLPRALSPAGGGALVHGRRVPMIGRISMDVTVVDLTDVPAAAPGDVATLVGRDGAAEITVDEVAGRVGTISYEVLTGLGPRLPRVYLES
jgi:alanine racemase